jgi:broad specificity phosphatase PhoE
MYLLRHGQSYFNLYFSERRVDPGIEDPELTPLGTEQAQAAARKLAGAALTRIIVSPYTRALQTAEPIRAAKGVPVEVMHLVRERAAFACDIGSAPEQLSKRFPQHDFAHIPRQWWHDGLESEEHTVMRANQFRALVADRPDGETTLLVSHWAFILALTGVSLDNGELMQYDPTTGASSL